MSRQTRWGSFIEAGLVMTYEEYDLIELENAVANAKAQYVKARNAREPSATLWNHYARLLHTYRLRRRSLNGWTMI